MKLKKILLASAIVASLAGIMATSSFAEEAKMTATWDAASKSVIIENCPTAAARKTLLVLTTNKDGSQLTNVAEENIKQIDEQTDAYTKVPVGDLADGTYEVRVGGDGTIAYAMFTVSTAPDNPYKNSTRLIGDIDGNGSIGLSDAGLAINHELGTATLTGESLQAGDVDGNLGVGLSDAGYIISYELGTDTSTIDGKKTVADRTEYIPE